MRPFGPDVVLDETAFVADSAQLYGRVRLGPEVSVWPNAVVRAEMHEVSIGEGSNLQDFVMVHVGNETGTHVGRNCSITHRVTLHGCRIGDHCLIGINATVMDGVEIGENSIVAGHAFLPAGKRYPANAIIAGIPGTVVRQRNNFVANGINAYIYRLNAQAFARGEHRAWSDPELAGLVAAERARLEDCLAKQEAKA